ncbi:MAG: dephospho-CoA kinase [Gammaproteobacteria bacterium]|nr:dephospho-CoA kinase [Gammaproteobacteria bacterium]
MLRVGLTGGICAGKTTVAELFRALQVPIVDADELAHSLVEPGQPALRAIVARFGDKVLQADGSLNRRLLREHVFARPAERKVLESILHPAIREQTETLLAAFEQAGTIYAINVVPLLVESGLTTAFDRILVVDVHESVQRERLMMRDGIDAEQAERILATQATRQQRLDAADDIIHNDDSQATLGDHVQRLHLLYGQLARSASQR